jgi:hypothetical protein
VREKRKERIRQSLRLKRVNSKPPRWSTLRGQARGADGGTTATRPCRGERKCCPS